ncbi:hypothetical protein Ahy_B05g077781 [Arachis hypogaea]|uniref:BHLH domain-containing protein n=1 Tax=Arachis hypogaea TaxID=3818 RepID=A0A444Z5I7_ARAHY|nr:hypothetical protein Ahy_B05g077781 [Arachis hypogaea]
MFKESRKLLLGPYCKITWRILIGVAMEYVIRQPIPEVVEDLCECYFSPSFELLSHDNKLGLSLDQGKGADGAAAPGVGFLKPPEEASGSGKHFRDDVLDARAKNGFEFRTGTKIQLHVAVFHGQPMPTTIPETPHPPTMRPRVRARRGQATDPHSIAERLRKERIAERIRALQELVPSVNKTDRTVMYCTYLIDLSCFYPRNKLLPSSIPPALLFCPVLSEY